MSSTIFLASKNNNINYFDDDEYTKWLNFENNHSTAKEYGLRAAYEMVDYYSFTSEELTDEEYDDEIYEAIAKIMSDPFLTNVFKVIRPEDFK